MTSTRAMPRIRSESVRTSVSVGLFHDTSGLATCSITSLTVGRLSYAEALSFVARHHYSRGMSAGPITYGLFHKLTLVGVCAFATPIGETVRAALFGAEHVNRVTELHRLVLLDETPRNAESFFVVRALRLLKSEYPHLWGVVTYADTTEGHVGVIYQATNAIYTGVAPARTQYVDSANRLRPHRQDGVEVTSRMAAGMGWTRTRRGIKHRYVFLLADDRRHRRVLDQLLRLPRLPYPKKSDAPMFTEVSVA